MVDELKDEIQLPFPAKNFDQVDQVLVTKSLKIKILLFSERESNRRPRVEVLQGPSVSQAQGSFKINATFYSSVTAKIIRSGTVLISAIVQCTGCLSISIPWART